MRNIWFLQENIIVKNFPIRIFIHLIGITDEGRTKLETENVKKLFFLLNHKEIKYIEINSQTELINYWEHIIIHGISCRDMKFNLSNQLKTIW